MLHTPYIHREEFFGDEWINVEEEKEAKKNNK